MDYIAVLFVEEETKVLFSVMKTLKLNDWERFNPVSIL